jgi:hypothetical protein
MGDGMNRFLTAFVFIICSAGAALAGSYKICKGDFALCAASSSTPTGKQITIGTTSFPEAMAVCPILHGPAIADVNGGNMKGDCAPPGKGQVWSLYQVREKIPQAPDWKRNTAAPVRTFTTSADNGISNMFSFACTRVKPVNGVPLAHCYGPINESPSGKFVPPGTDVITQAPVGATYPIGGPIP